MSKHSVDPQTNFDLQKWVGDYLPSGSLFDGPMTLTPLTGDAGFRRYFRTNTQPSLIAVAAPPNLENNLAFVHVAQSFAQGGISVPKVHAVDFHAGFLLLQDFGEQVLQPLLSGDTVANHYSTAETVLLDIQQLPHDSHIFPNYDAIKLKQELRLFVEWFVGALLGLQLSEQEKALLQSVDERLVDNALAQPQVAVHRDYHSRNLMLLQDGQLGVIDFQDAVWGPITYDLVSLLKDCYIRWPTSLVAQRATDYQQQIEALGLMPKTDSDEFLRWFDWMGLQRHIKVLGIFSRLALRDSKERYLNDLPRVIDYVLEVTARYPDLHSFDDWFQQRLLPEIQKQAWFGRNQFSKTGH